MESIGAVASVLAIATAAFQVSKALNDTLVKIKDAPDEFSRLSEDLQSMSLVLSSLKTTLNN